MNSVRSVVLHPPAIYQNVVDHLWLDQVVIGVFIRNTESLASCCLPESTLGEWSVCLHPGLFICCYFMFAKRKSIMPVSSLFPLGFLELKGRCGHSNAGPGLQWLRLGGRHVRRGGVGQGIAGSQGSCGASSAALLVLPAAPRALCCRAGDGLLQPLPALPAPPCPPPLNPAMCLSAQRGGLL